MNVIARLEYELAYYDSAVYRFNHYTTRTPPKEEKVEVVVVVVVDDDMNTHVWTFYPVITSDE